jgi:hypothetical protein
MYISKFLFHCHINDSDFLRKVLTQFRQKTKKNKYCLQHSIPLSFLISEQLSVSLGYFKLTLLTHESIGHVIITAPRGLILHDSFRHWTNGRCFGNDKTVKSNEESTVEKYRFESRRSLGYLNTVTGMTRNSHVTRETRHEIIWLWAGLHI